MNRQANLSRRRELQVAGTFLFMLGAGLVLDRAFPVLGAILWAVGALVLVWALRQDSSGEFPSAAPPRAEGTGPESLPPGQTP